MKSNDYFISSLNKGNIITYRNNKNNSDNDNNSGSDSYDVNKRRVTIQIKT